MVKATSGVTYLFRKIILMLSFSGVAPISDDEKPS